MSESRQRSQHDARIRPGHASHNRASHSNTSTAPPGIGSDPGAFHGHRQQEFNQMHDLLGTLDPFAINQELEYTTERGVLSHLHPRDDEIDLSAAGHSTIPLYQGGLAQDSFGKNVDEYLQRPTAPAWNPAIAAQQSSNTLVNTLQRIQLSVPHLTPPRQHICLTDEGYYTCQRSQQDTRSERSDRSNSFSQMTDRPQAIPRSIPDQQSMRGLSQGRAGDFSMDSEQTPIHGGTKSDAESNVGTIQCRMDGCSVMSKTPSDDKKHLARHKLEHVCTKDDCSRHRQGFATVNDLNRHKLTVHKERPKGTRIYRCLAPGCNKPDKEWPRKDNFRSHLKKAHPHEDVEDLTKQSDEAWDLEQRGSTGSDDQEMYIGPAAPVTRPSQRVARPEILFHPSPASDSGTEQTSSVPQPRFSQHSYVPRCVQWPPRPMPGTTQYFNWEDALQRQQMATPLGYRNDNSDIANIRSFDQSLGEFPHSSSVTLPEQHHPHQPRTSFEGATVPYARTKQHTEHHQIPDWLSPEPTASQMLRAASSNRPVFHVSTQSRTAGQRPQTVAHFPSLEEDRQEDMLSFPAYQQFQQPSNTGYHEGGEMLSGVGLSIDDDTYHSTFVDDVMPQSRAQQPEQLEIDRTNEDNVGDVNVGSLKKFLEPFTTRADDDPAKVRMKSFLTHALLSLKSMTGEASSAASGAGAVTDHYIEEHSSTGEKRVFRCMWPKCNSNKKEWNLRSEIKKHMKRHSKPYGCTFDKCYRQFGSKSDWVRHETKRHTLKESWRCIRPNPRVAPAIQPCRRVFWSKQHFVAHLSDTHKLTEENTQEDFITQLTKQHINANFQPQYWCGFHKTIIRHAKKSKEGIHERYNHIAEHITGEGRCMEDWMPAHGILSRGQLRAKFPPKQGQLPDDEEDDDASPHVSTSEESTSTNDNDGSPSPPRGDLPTEPPPIQHRQQIQQLQSQPQAPHGPPPAGHTGQKRTASMAGMAPSGQRSQRGRANFWRCHACQHKNLLAISPACTSGSCSHEKCPICTHVYQPNRDER